VGQAKRASKVAELVICIGMATERPFFRSAAGVPCQQDGRLPVSCTQRTVIETGTFQKRRPQNGCRD